MFGLKKVLELINIEGLENRWKRHIEMSEFTINWSKNHGQRLFPENDFHSFTLTCLKNIRKWDINTINEKLLERGFRMDRGYGNLKGKVFRIPHMGNVHMEDLQEYLNHIDEILCQLKY